LLETGDGPAELRTFEPGLQWLGLEVHRHTVLGEDRAEVPFVSYSKFGTGCRRAAASCRKLFGGSTCLPKEWRP